MVEQQKSHDETPKDRGPQLSAAEQLRRAYQMKLAFQMKEAATASGIVPIASSIAVNESSVVPIESLLYSGLSALARAREVLRGQQPGSTRLR